MAVRVLGITAQIGQRKGRSVLQRLSFVGRMKIESFIENQMGLSVFGCPPCVSSFYHPNGGIELDIENK
jgi:hypothetical protein